MTPDQLRPGKHVPPSQQPTGALPASTPSCRSAVQFNSDRLAAAIQAVVAEEVARQTGEVWKRVRKLEAKFDQLKWAGALKEPPPKL